MARRRAKSASENRFTESRYRSGEPPSTARSATLPDRPPRSEGRLAGLETRPKQWLIRGAGRIEQARAVPWILPLRDPRAIVWFDRLIPVVLVAAALALYLPRLAIPSWYTFDETVHAFTAGEYVEGNADAYRWDAPCSVGGGTREACVASDPDADVNSASEGVRWRGVRVGRYEWTHPPLGMQLIAGGILLFGDDAFGWRIAGTVFGAIGIVLAYRIALALTRRRSIALLTSGLLLLDGLYFVQSRRAVLDIFGTVFMMAALLSFAYYLRSPPDRARWPLVSTGAFLGLGIAVKWNAAFASVLIGGVVLYRLVRLWPAGRGRGADPAARTGLRQHLVWVPIALMLIPLAEYVIVHIPFFLEGYGLSDFVDLQRARFSAREAGLAPPVLNPDGTWQNRSSSRWWEWPLALSPVYHGRFVEGDTVAVSYANGNPLLYWGFLPAMLWVSRRWWRARNPALLVLLIGFFGQWLPWALLSHTSFAYHFLPAVPFGCVAVAVAVVELCRGNTGWRRTLAIEYVVLVALAFAFFYPIHAYVPLGEHWLEIRLLLPSWKR